MNCMLFLLLKLDEKKNSTQRTGAVPKEERKIERSTQSTKKGVDAPKKGKCASQDLKKGKGSTFYIEHIHTLRKKGNELNVFP